MFRFDEGSCMNPKVLATRCDEYDPLKLRAGMKEHLDNYMKFKDLKGKKVLLKINLLSATEPERAVTTHPEFVHALIEEIHERGGEVLIADSPGGLFNKATLKNAYKVSGILKVAQDTGAELNYNTGSHVVKHSDGNFLRSFNVCDYMDECDLKIAVPKIKTHMFCGLTCASKIMFGAVPGTEKVKYHTRFPDTVDFSKMLQDLTDLCDMDLFIVDGIIGMEGRGPARGTPRKVGVILSGNDPRTIDLHVSRITGLDPERLSVLKAAKEMGQIEYDQRIEVSGNARDQKLEKPFKPAQGGSIFTRPPRFLKRIMINIANDKPYVAHKKCVGCGVCRDNCAGEAITIKNNIASIDYSKCIRCYCCHELCPHDSIYLSVKESGLATWVSDYAYRRFGTPGK